MSNTIDNRIVKMEFDNSNFEKNVKVSLETLDKLDAKLNDAPKSAEQFKKIEKASEEVTLAKMADAVDSIQQRFSALGIVGMTVIQDLTNSALNFVKSIGSNTIGQVWSGGLARASNIEQAKFQIEGLGYAWEDVSWAIEEAVNETAYGLDSAAKAASQLLASGVEPGEKLMLDALRGISGVAAMTNSTYDDIARIFTTVAGNGRLMGMQLTQLGQRGLNVAADLADAIGVSEQELRKMASQGLIDFNTFAEAMNTKYGTHAKEANKTVTGTISNIKAALSRVGADFFTPIIKNSGPLVNFLNSVRENINAWRTDVTKNLLNENGVAGVVTSLLEKLTDFNIKFRESFFGNGEDQSFNSIKDKLSGLGISWDAFQEKAIAAAKSNGIAIDDLISKYGSFDDSLNDGWLSGKLFSSILTDIADNADVTSASAEDLTGKLEEIQSLVHSIWMGDWGNGQERYDALTAAGWDYDYIQGLVDLGIDYEVTLEDLSDAQLTSIGYTEDQIAAIRELAKEAETAGTTLSEFLANPAKMLTNAQLLQGSLRNIGHNFVEFFKSIGSAWGEIFEGTGTKLLRSFLEGLYNITEKFRLTEEQSENLKRSFKGLFAILDIIGQAFQIITIPLGKLLSLLPSMNGKIFEFTGGIGDALVKFDNFIKESEVFRKIGEGIVDVFTLIGNAFKLIGKLINTGLTPLRDWLHISDETSDHMKTGFLDGLHKIGDAFSWLKEKIQSASEFLSKLTDNLTNPFKKINEKSETVFFGGKNKITKSASIIVDGVKSIGSAVDETTEKIQSNPFSNPFVNGVFKMSDSLKTLKKTSDETTKSVNENNESMAKSFLENHPLLAGLIIVAKGLGHVFSGIGKVVGEQLQKLGAKLQDFTFTTEHFKVVLEVIKTLIGSILGFKLVKSVSTLNTNLGKIGISLSNFFNNLSGGINRLLGGFGAKDQPSKLELIGKFFIRLAASIAIIAGSMTLLANIRTDRLIAGVSAVTAIIGALTACILLLQRFTQITQPVVRNWEKTGKHAGKSNYSGPAILANWLQTTAQGTLFLKVAASLIIIGAAVKMIGSIGSPSQIKAATGAMIAIMGALTAMVTLMGEFFGQDSKKTKSIESLDHISKSLEKVKTNFLGMGLLLISISISVGIIADAVRKMGTMNTDEISKGLIGLGVIIGGLIGIAAALKLLTNKISPAQATIFGAAIDASVSLAISLWIMAGSVRKLANQVVKMGDLDNGQLARGLIGLELCIGSLIAIQYVMEKFHGDKALKKSFSMVLLAFALNEVAVAISYLGWIKPETLGQGLAGVGIILGEFLGVLAIMKRFKLTTELKMAGTLVAFGFALNEMCVPIMLLGYLPWDVVLQGTITAGVVMAALALAGKIMNGVELKISSAASLIAIAGGLLVATPAVVGLGLLNTVDVIQGIAALSSLFGVLYFGARIAQGVKDGLLALSIGLLAFGAAVGGIGAFLAAISTLITVLSGLNSLMVAGIIEMFGLLAEGIGDSIAKIIKSITVGIIEGIGGAIVQIIKDIIKGFVEGFVEMIEFLADNAEKVTDAIMRILIGIIRGIANRIGELVDAVVELFDEFFAALERHAINPDELLQKILISFGMVAGLMYVASTLGPLFLPAVVGVAAATGIVVEMAALFALIGKLSEWLPDMAELVEKGGDILMKVGQAIGKFIGGIVGGVVEGFSNSMPTIADNLSTFMTNLQPFLEGVRNLDERTIAGVNYVIGVFQALEALSFADLISRWLGGTIDFSKWGEQLDQMVEAIKNFGEKAAQIPANVLESAALASDALAAIAGALNALPHEGGLQGLVFGSVDASEWANQLSPLAEGLKNFAEASKDITPEMAEAAKNAAEIITVLAEACDQIPNEGASLAKFFVGDNRPADWAPQLQPLAEGIVAFAVALKDGSNGAFTDGSEMSKWIKGGAWAVKELADACDQIPNEGASLAHFFVGDNAPEKWAKQLKPLGEGITDFAVALKSGSNGSFTSGTEVLKWIKGGAWAVKELADACSEIPNDGGAFGFLTGELFKNQMFAKDLILLGAGIAGFAEQVKDINSEKMSVSVTAIKTLSELDMSGFDADSSFGDALSDIAEGISDFFDKLPDVNSLTTLSTTLPYIKTAIDLVSAASDSIEGRSFEDLTFKSALADIANGLRYYIQSVGKLDISRLTSDAEVINAFYSSIADVIPTEGGLLSLILGGGENINAIGVGIGYIGYGLYTYMAHLRNASIDRLNGDSEIIKTFFTTLSDIPGQKGFLGFLLSENISRLGEGLAAIGSGIADYIINIRSADLKGGAYGTGRLPTDAKNLKDFLDLLTTASTSGGMLDYIFGEDQTWQENFSSFGDTLSTFITKMRDINSEQLKTAMTNFETLLNSFNNLSADRLTYIQNFVTSVNNLFTMIYENILGKFSDYTEIDTVMASFIGTATTSLYNNSSTLTDTWSTIVTAMVDYMASDTVNTQKFVGSVNTFVSNIAIDLLSEFNLGKLFKVGYKYTDYIVSGIQAVDPNTGTNRFYTAGINAIDGFILGLSDPTRLTQVGTAAWTLGRTAYEATRKALDEHSPSKKYFETGDFAGLGFVNGLVNRVKEAETAGRDLGNASLDSIRAAIDNIDFDDYFDLNPVIRPILDLSDVASKASMIESIFNQNSKLYGNIQNGDGLSTNGTTVNFTQNNYSPKALSRKDIYRQTRNQLSMAKGGIS